MNKPEKSNPKIQTSKKKIYHSRFKPKKNTTIRLEWRNNWTWENWNRCNEQECWGKKTKRAFSFRSQLMRSKITSPNNAIYSHQGTTTHLPTNCHDPSKQIQNAHHRLFSSVRQATNERPWFQIWALQCQCQSPSHQSLKPPPNRDE